MTEATVLKLFKEFTNGAVDLFGLKCTPIVINSIHEPEESTYHIGFEIENPSNVSYFGPIVHEELFELVNSFGEYLNIKAVPIILWGHNRTEFHLNGEIRNKIQKVFDSVRELKFTTGTPFIGHKRWVIQIESTGLKTRYYDAESYYIDNTVVPISATKNGENVDVDEAINTYIDDFLAHYAEPYYETEEYYGDVDGVISQYPLLHADYVATYYDTKFIR
jgi:hypothetical protein